MDFKGTGKLVNFQLSFTRETTLFCLRSWQQAPSVNGVYSKRRAFAADPFCLEKIPFQTGLFILERKKELTKDASLAQMEEI